MATDREGTMRRHSTIRRADDAESWWREQGNEVPPRNSESWCAMYVDWVKAAFGDLDIKAVSSMQGRTMEKFPLGDIIATPAVLDQIAKSGQRPEDFLDRHVAGDWGEVCDDDKLLNDQALVTGERLLSAYTTLLNTRLWIITEADRSVTCLLLPEEY
jgi:hypothetical protein